MHDQVQRALQVAVSDDREARLVRVVRQRAENPDPDADAQLLDGEPAEATRKA